MEPNRTDLTKEEILFSHLELGRDTYLSNQESRILKAMEFYSEQKEKPLLERIAELEKALIEFQRFIPSIRTCVDKEFQHSDNCLKVLDDIEQVLNTKS